MTRTYTTALTHLMQFVFVAMLVFTGLTTTGCGLVDSNNPDEITIEKVLSQETAESIADEASTAGQAADDEEGAGVGNTSGAPYSNPVKDDPLP